MDTQIIISFGIPNSIINEVRLTEAILRVLTVYDTCIFNYVLAMCVYKVGLYVAFLFSKSK
jgi:hypothetical protein